MTQAPKPIITPGLKEAYWLLSPAEREFYLMHENLHRQYHNQEPLTDADFVIKDSADA